MNIHNSPIQFAPIFDMLVRKYDLPYEAFVLGNSSAMAPYHNLVHARNVVEDAVLMFTNMCPNKFIDYGQLLLTAALLHDFGHTAGREKDDVNIAIACEAAKTISYTYHYNVPELQELIQCTEYSGGLFVTEPEDDISEALRDADICTIFHIYEPEGLSQYEGLLTEINTSLIRENKSPLTARQFMEGNTDFLKNAKYYTEAGNMLKDNYLEQCLEVFNSYFMGGDTRKERERNFMGVM